jgi:hypothetical protein
VYRCFRGFIFHSDVSVGIFNLSFITFYGTVLTVLCALVCFLFATGCLSSLGLCLGSGSSVWLFLGVGEGQGCCWGWGFLGVCYVCVVGFCRRVSKILLWGMVC